MSGENRFSVSWISTCTRPGKKKRSVGRARCCSRCVCIMRAGHGRQQHFRCCHVQPKPKLTQPAPAQIQILNASVRLARLPFVLQLQIQQNAAVRANHNLRNHYATCGVQMRQASFCRAGDGCGHPSIPNLSLRRTHSIIVRCTYSGGLPVVPVCARQGHRHYSEAPALL